MDFISYVVNGMALAAGYYAAKALFGNEIQDLISKSEA